jgi:hypothetical protein
MLHKDPTKNKQDNSHLGVVLRDPTKEIYEEIKAGIRRRNRVFLKLASEIVVENHPNGGMEVRH